MSMESSNVGRTTTTKNLPAEKTSQDQDAEPCAAKSSAFSDQNLAGNESFEQKAKKKHQERNIITLWTTFGEFSMTVKPTSMSTRRIVGEL